MAITRSKIRTNNLKPLADCKLLLVEDQQSIAQALSSMLNDQWGCDVTIANSYKQAEQILKADASQFFLTISDLNLPEANNGEIIDLLIEHKQSVIAVTGFFDKTLSKYLTEKGVIDYVLKQNINSYEFIVKLVGRLYFNKFIKVLVIDDSESVQKLTGAYLERQFLNVCYAKNGVEGLEVLDNHPEIKLVLVDSEMPVMDGLTFTAIARQRQNQNNLCIIGISSSTQKDLSSQFLKQGANDYISKPYSYDEITCRVNQNLTMLSYIEEISNIANMDFLTQLPNRRNFFSKGDPVIAQAIANKKHTVVAILDIDFFKKVNDTYGHDCGDQALKHVANIIQSILGKHAVSRLGGEEFGCIIQETNFSVSSALLESLRVTVAESSLTYEEQEIKLTISIGATYELRENLDKSLKLADEYLYLAKTSGRNKIVWNHTRTK